MDTNEPNQTLTEVQIVKEEAVEQQHTSCDEDRLTVSQFLLSRQNPLDSSPIVVEPERPCSGKKRTPLLVNKRGRGPKKRMISDFSSSSQSGKRKRDIEGNFSDHREAHYSQVIKRAEEVRASLSTEFPSFIKLMLRSHVTHGFWLGLPSKFCKLHLPRHDYTIVLESESGDEYKTNFLVDKRGLSGGWKGFSIAQKLLEGDVVVFHLVRPCKFKVHIVRANDLAVVNGAPSLPYFVASATKGTDFEKNSGTCEKAEEKHSRLVSPNILRENIEENNTVTVRIKMPCRVDHYKRWKTSGDQRNKHQEDQSAQPVEQPTSRVGHCKRWKRSTKQRTKHQLDQSTQSVEQQPTCEKNATTPEDESEEESYNKHIEDSEESKEENETNEKYQLTQQEEQEDQEIIHEKIEMMGGIDEVDLVCTSLFQTPHTRAAIGTECGCEKEMEGLKKERDEAVKMLSEITRSNEFACQQLKELQEQNDKLTAEQERLHAHIGSLPHRKVGHTEGHQGETGNQIVSDNPRKSEHSKRKREAVDSFSDHLETQFSRVMERAEEVQASLSLAFPSFIRLIVQSQVTQGFWLGLPLKFCKLHLPSHNETVVLEDESGEEYKTNFLVGKCGLSGGWKGFSVAHKLLEGDAVVFQLVKHCKFKMVFDYPRSSQRCCKKKREIENNFSDHLEAHHSRVIKRAEEVRASLPTEFPSFIKLMIRSHVTHGFWLGIPSTFCKLHMPMHDDTVVLEDERGEEYHTNFLVNKGGLSGGWRGFSSAHKLLEGDAVLFHLIRPCKFKVYIVRANDLAVDNGARRLLCFDACAKETDSEKNSGTCEIAEEQPEQNSRLVSPNILQENVEENNTKTVRVKMPCRVDDDHCKRWKRFKEQITEHKDDHSAQPVQEQPTTSVGHCKRKKETVGSFSDQFETQFSQVMERAKEVQESLSLEFPSFIRLILRRHVTIGYWLGLPRKFCKLHLPSHNVTIILEDESGREYKTKYLVCQWGLSGGWKGFSVTQKLLEGDAVVFQLVKHCKFKVYIVRASNLSVVDRAVTDQCESDEENLYSSDKESLELSGSIADFENFNIIVNGITIDSMFSIHIWTKYYNLCSSQKSYLHKHLPKNIDCTLAVGIINETINISDAIRACKLSSLGDDLAIWDKTLKAFGQLGMNVGFLRARLNRLVSLALELMEAPESKRYEEARVERERAEEEKASLELKLVKLKQAKSRLDDEIETLEEYARECEVVFQEEANAPW